MKERSRKRGVIASRAKLEKAMQSAGLTTQASLAKKIADLEGLDGEPRDMVSKAFRGKPVEHHTLARIAAALDVEAFSLYLSSTEVQHSDDFSDESIENGKETSQKQSNPIQSQQAKPQNNRIALFLGSTIVVIAVIGFLAFKTEAPSSTLLPFSITIGEKPRLVVVAMEDNDLEGIKKALSEKLAENFDIAISSILKYSPKLSPWEIPNELSVDYVIHIETHAKGELKALFINIFTDNRKILLFADAWSAESLPDHAQQISIKTVQELKSLFGLKAAKNTTTITDKKAVLHYMDGINIKLEGTMNLMRVNQALSHFQLAIDLSPQYIKAQAAKCLSLSDSYHLTRDIAQFKQAIKDCESYQKVAENNPSYHAAMGSMYRRIGSLDKAIFNLTQTLELTKNNVPAHINLALSQFTKGSKTKDQDLIKASIQTINKAIELAPSRWVTYHNKSMIQYSSGDSKGAIITQEKAVSFARNTTTINNLASFHFCSGKMSRAKELFEEVLTFKDTPLTAKYNLASVYSFFLENEKAADMMEEYFHDVKSKKSEIHTVALIGLADIYNQMKNYTNARKNYELAYQQLEAERLNGQKDPMHEVHSRYIEIALGTLANAVLTKSEVEKHSKRLEALEPMSGHPNVKVMLIFGWSLLNNLEKAKVLFEALAPQCQAMAEAPIFKHLKP